MNLVQRVQDILLKPRQTWPVIATEADDAASIYTRYVMILAAIPAVAAFIGLTLVGVGAFGVSYRLPLLTGLVQMVVSYVLSLVMVFVLTQIVNALAPTFGGSKSPIQALKLVAYSSTAGFVGGVFSLIPALGIIGLVASLYSIWLLYTGISTLMRNPPEKSAAYTAVVIVCAIIVAIVISFVLSLFTPAARLGMAAAGAGANVTVKGSDGSTVTLDTAGLDAMSKRMEAAAQRADAAQKSGDPAAAGKAAAEVMAAMTGSSTTPIPAGELKAMLPETIGDLKRTGFESSSGQAMGLAGSTAKATYAGGERRIDVSLVDSGGLAGMASLAGWAGVTMDKETDVKIEKIYKEGNRTIREEYRKDGSHGELTTILANGVIVAVEGRRTDLAELKKVVASLDLGKLESMKRAEK